MNSKKIKFYSNLIIIVVLVLYSNLLSFAGYMGKGDNSSNGNYYPKNQVNMDSVLNELNNSQFIVANSNMNFSNYPIYKVHNGDSLWSISVLIGITPDEIRNINNLNSDNLVENQNLIITSNFGHRVLNGDTLWQISRNYNTSVEKLKLVNSLIGDNLSLGSLLLIPRSTYSANFDEYKGNIKHIFFHALIAFPDIAYSGDVKGKLDTDCVTATEFKRCLAQLYINNYVLIDLKSSYQVINKNGIITAVPKTVYVPKGKKPLILSVDDMVYDYNKKGWGMVDKLMIDKNGNVYTYTKQANGKEIISYNNDIIPILDNFVKSHPDFSINGAKATLALTGFVGVFGYRTDRTAPNRTQEINAVKPLISKLKNTGYTFASHGYGHRHTPKITYWLFSDDTTKWRTEVESLLGPTDIYIYPYGEAVFPGDAKYTLLKKYGFNFFCGVSPQTYWETFNDSLFMTRQGIDGYSLRFYGKYLSPFFDVKKIFEYPVRNQ